MSEDRLRAASARARQFREWAEGDEGLYRVFDAVERDYLSALITSDIADHPLREKVYHRVNALRDIRKVIETAITEGKSAEAMIADMAKVADKKRKQ